MACIVSLAEHGSSIGGPKLENYFSVWGCGPTPYHNVNGDTTLVVSPCSTVNATDNFQLVNSKGDKFFF